MGFSNIDKLIAQAKKDAAKIEPKVLKKILYDEDDVIILY